MSRFIVSKSFLHIIIVASIGMLSCKKSEVKFNDFADSDVFFEVSRSLSTKNSETTEQNQSTTFYTDPSDEIWVNKTITELKKLNEKDKYVTKVKQKVGLPIWNRSLVFFGGDSTKTVITPIYDTVKKIVKGVIFSFHGSQFNCRVVPRSIVNSFRDTARSINSVSKESIKAIFNYFDTQKANYVYNDLISGVNKIKVSEDNVITTGEIQYLYCYYVLVSSYNSGGVFQRQCVTQTYWGSYQEWDFYYSDFDNQEGYYDSFSEEEIQKAEENLWELDALDTIGLSNPCVANLIGKLMLNSTDIGKIVRKFYDKPYGYALPMLIPKTQINLKFEVVPTLGQGASIKKGSDGVNFIVQINKSRFSQCTDLYAAQTLIHEIIHAYMIALRHSGRIFRSNEAGIFSTTIFDNVSKVFNEHIDDVMAGINGTGSEIYQHAYMADYLVCLMADALSEFDGHRLDYEYYWSLSWGGLFETKAWESFLEKPESESLPSGLTRYPMTEERLANINEINLAEQNNSYEAKGKKHNNKCY